MKFKDYFESGEADSDLEGSSTLWLRSRNVPRCEYYPRG
jgi:hypothetical protein